MTYDEEDFLGAEGQTPEEGDYVYGDHRGRTSVSEVGGKHLGSFATEEEALRFLFKRMVKEKFWPNVWFQDDHGGVRLEDDNALRQYLPKKLRGGGKKRHAPASRLGRLVSSIRKLTR